MICPCCSGVGVAYDFIMSPNAILTMSGELKHPNDNLQQGGVGAEMAFHDSFFLRGGVQTQLR